MQANDLQVALVKCCAKANIKNLSQNMSSFIPSIYLLTFYHTLRLWKSIKHQKKNNILHLHDTILYMHKCSFLMLALTFWCYANNLNHSDSQSKSHFPLFMLLIRGLNYYILHKTLVTISAIKPLRKYGSFKPQRSGP